MALSGDSTPSGSISGQAAGSQGALAALATLDCGMKRLRRKEPVSSVDPVRLRSRGEVAAASWALHALTEHPARYADLHPAERTTYDDFARRSANRLPVVRPRG